MLFAKKSFSATALYARRAVLLKIKKLPFIKIKALPILKPERKKSFAPQYRRKKHRAAILQKKDLPEN
jgi:hypothetical protein